MGTKIDAEIEAPTERPDLLRNRVRSARDHQREAETHRPVEGNAASAEAMNRWLYFYSRLPQRCP